MGGMAPIQRLCDILAAQSHRCHPQAALVMAALQVSAYFYDRAPDFTPPT